MDGWTDRGMMWRRIFRDCFVDSIRALSEYEGISILRLPIFIPCTFSYARINVTVLLPLSTALVTLADPSVSSLIASS